MRRLVVLVFLIAALGTPGVAVGWARVSPTGVSQWSTVTTAAIDFPAQGDWFDTGLWIREVDASTKRETLNQNPDWGTYVAQEGRLSFNELDLKVDGVTDAFAIKGATATFVYGDRSTISASNPVVPNGQFQFIVSCVDGNNAPVYAVTCMATSYYPGNIALKGSQTPGAPTPLSWAGLLSNDAPATTYSVRYVIAAIQREGFVELRVKWASEYVDGLGVKWARSAETTAVATSVRIAELDIDQSGTLQECRDQNNEYVLAKTDPSVDSVYGGLSASVISTDYAEVEDLMGESVWALPAPVDLPAADIETIPEDAFIGAMDEAPFADILPAWAKDAMLWLQKQAAAITQRTIGQFFWFYDEAGSL